MYQRVCSKFASLTTWKILSVSRICNSQTRHLSSKQASIALRPFYGAVHPDLFGLFPEARNKNEESLKSLHEHLDRLQNQQSIKPIILFFFLKADSKLGIPHEETNKKSLLRMSLVRISLDASTLRDTVTLVLKSCNLPLDYINSIPIEPATKMATGETIVRGWEVPVQERVHQKPLTLSSWLRRNIDKAREAQRANEAIQLDIDRICNKLKKDAGLTEIRWESSWSMINYRACLKSLETLYDQHSHQLQLEGFGLTFGNASGVSSRSHIVLPCDNVPQIWLQVLSTVSHHAPALRRLRAHENQLSHLLRKAVIVRSREPIVLATNYLMQLRQLITDLERYLIDSGGLYYNLHNVEIVLTSMIGQTELNKQGQVIVPKFCPAFHLIDFLNDNVLRARSMSKTYKENESVIGDLAEQCVENLLLSDIDWDKSLTDEQLIQCLKKLRNPRNVGVSLHDCQLKITCFYSVMAGGKICIPWNWRSAYDEDD